MTAGIEEKKRWIENSGGRPDEDQLRKIREIIASKFYPKPDVHREELDQEICWIFGQYYRALGAGVGGFRSSKARRAAAKELRALYEETESAAAFDDRAAELGQLARWALYGGLRDDGSAGAFLVAASVDHRLSEKLSLPMHASEPRTVPTWRRVGDELQRDGEVAIGGHARDLAFEAAYRLERSLGPGQPPNAALNSLAEHLAKTWRQKSGKKLRARLGLRPFREELADRRLRTEQWFFLEFVEAVARVLDPNTTADGACQRLLRKNA